MGTKFKGSAEKVVALDAFIALMRAQMAAVQTLSSHAAFGDLTVSQFGVLETLLHLGPLSPNVLAKKILRTPGNLVTVIDNLVRDGWVRKERSTEDRRVVVISLTPAGQKLIRGLFPTHANHVQRAMSALTTKELEQLKSLCRKLGVGQASKRMVTANNASNRRKQP